MRSTMKGTSGLRSLRPIAGAISRPEEGYVVYFIYGYGLYCHIGLSLMVISMMVTPFRVMTQRGHNPSGVERTGRDV